MPNDYSRSRGKSKGGGRGNDYSRAGRSGGGGRTYKGLAVPSSMSSSGWLHNIGAGLERNILGFPGGVKGATVGTVHSLENAAQGIATGGRHPAPMHHDTLADVGAAIAKDYAYRWGPLFQGLIHQDPHEFAKFGHRFKQDPISDLLDAITAASLGTSGAVKLGILKEAPRSFELRSPGATAGKEGASVIEKQVIGSELGRRMRLGSDRVLKRLPADLQVLGEHARFAREQQLRELKAYTRHKLYAEPRGKAYKALNTDEKIAANLMSDFPHPADLQRAAATDENLAKILRERPQIRELHDHPSAKMEKFIEEDAALGAKMADIIGMTPEAAELRRFKPSLLARGAHYVGDELVAPEGKTIPGLIEEIKADLAAEGRPGPRYRPQKSATEKSVGLGPGGIGIPRRYARQNRGILQAMGRVAYNIDTLTPEYSKAIRWASYNDRHDDLMAAAKAVDKIESGQTYIRKLIWNKGKARPQKGPSYTEHTGPEFQDLLDQVVGEGEGKLAEGPTKENQLTTTNPELAERTPEGKYLVVPDHFAKKIVGEYQKQHAVFKYLWEKPTDVWRAVVLNLRVGWLVNNVVGNSLLYIMKNADPEGFMQFMGRAGLSREAMMEHLPEHYAGVFYGTQSPVTGRIGRISESNYNPVAWGRRGDIRYEQRLRRKMASRLAKKNPEVRARLKAMPKETRSLDKAAGEALTPADWDRISQQINNALGDYFSLGKHERGVIRAVFPFYAWYKAITKITLKMPVDSPGATAILVLLSRLGTEMEADNTAGLPPWLAGSVGLPGGYVLGTQAANPYSTGYSTGRGFAGGDWYAQQQRLGLFHPFVQAIINAQGEQGSLPINIGKELGKEVTGLPPVRLAFPPHRKSYEGSDYLRELFSYLGIPIKKPVR